MDRNPDTQVQSAIGALPMSLQSVALRQLERYYEPGDRPEIPADMLEPLLRLLVCSEYGANTFHREWAWLLGRSEALQAPPDPAELQDLVQDIAASDETIDAIKSRIRRFRNRYFLHVLWREFAAAASLDETLTSISGLADALLQAATAYAENIVRERFGRVHGDDGEPVSIVILGMGKLGGRELNFSSDIDLIFLHPNGGDSDGRRALSAHEYFTRVSRIIVALIEEPTADGFAFRVDTRLRPFGDSGPPVTSFAALESYLLRHGRNWERYAYVKARSVGPPLPVSVETDLYDNLITPFVYRRYLDYGVFESLREMHTLIAAEVKRRELADNIKLGPGGIREIEFIVQSLQLVRGGSRTELQGRQLLSILPRLTGRNGIDPADVEILRQAYEFLRRLENFIQALRDQQTHELPVDSLDRERLALAMHCPSWGELRRQLDTHRNGVAEQFARVAFRRQNQLASKEPWRQFKDLWMRPTSQDNWTAALLAEGFPAPQEIAETICTFKNTAAHADAESNRRLQQFVPNLLVLLKDATAPKLALQRTLAIAEQVLRRSAYLALLNENSAAMQKLVGLCARSAFVAREIARYPVLLDELLDSGIDTDQVSRAGLQLELDQQLQTANIVDSEGQMELLARFQRASQFRIALADFSGSLPIMRVSDCLTYLAEVVLNHSLQVAWRDLTEKHGSPGQAGFGIVGYGKLGGLELSYGSDLDLVFLHDSAAAGGMTDGRNPLDHTMFFTRLVRRLVHFLTTQTGSGVLYEIDTRLRPDGKSGLLVTSVEAFERYQNASAWTWEHQALLRARPVAGSDSIAAKFESIRRNTLSKLPHDTLRKDVVSMRARMRQQLDKSDAEAFDLKQGKGGIGDIEFLVQYLVLANAASHPSVIEYSDNIRQLDALAASGCMAEETALQVQSAYRDYRLHVHHLLLDEQAAMSAQSDFERQRGTIVQVWAQYLGD